MLKSLFKSLRNKSEELCVPDKDKSRQNKIATNLTLKSEYYRDYGYVDYPNFVHIETLSVCNAACCFCPYTTLTRKGHCMPDAVIEKIIDDLAAIPKHVKFQIAPYKVSDPFLEPRLFDIIAQVRDRLPNAGISLITNGTALTEKKIEQLSNFSNISNLTISLNDVDPVRYEQIMALPLDRTLARMDILHARTQISPLSFPIRVTRVDGEAAENDSFMHFVSERFPLFQSIIVSRNDWIGEVITPGSLHEIPDAPCPRWFDFSITSTGEVAMCCMDGEGHYSLGNVQEQNILEIYNQPWLRNLRENLISRRLVQPPCSLCTYG